MNYKIQILILILLAIVGYSFFLDPKGLSLDSEDKSAKDNVMLEEIPDFSVKVKLSENAQQKLTKLNERIKVIAYFDGDGEAIPGEKTAPFRDVYLGRIERIIEYGEIAFFNHLQLPRENFNRLSSEDYYVTINVVSAREGHKNNLLSMEVNTGLISSFASKEILITGKLIGE